MIDYIDYQQMKWLSIYGASVAIQCHQLIRDGRSGELSDNMESIKQHYNEEYEIFTLFWFQFCLIDLFFPSKKPSNIKC